MYCLGAKVKLSYKKLEIYSDLINEIYSDIGKPDLYIYLECSTTEELQRIKSRNRAVENNIQLDFLLSLNKEISQDVQKIDTPNVLTINSEEYDFVHNNEDKVKVISMIRESLANM